jgi:hypothetical protein
MGRPEGRTPLGRRRHRWEDNIKMDLQEVGLRGGGMDLSVLAEDRDVLGTGESGMNLWVP